MTPSRLISRRRRAAMLIGLGLILISISFIQQVVAQKPSLKQPLHLIHTDADVPILPPPPLDAPIIISQTFDSSFHPETDPSAVGWHQEVGAGRSNDYTWGAVITGPRPNTVWSSAFNKTGTPPVLVPGTPYTNGQESLLVYGPIDLHDYAAVVMTATYFSDVQPGDAFGAVVSTDGAYFRELTGESGLDPSLTMTHTNNYDLTPYRQSTVWLGFYFTSNNDDLLALGVYLQSFALRGVPLNKYYLPSVQRGPTATPTRTPTPTATPTRTPTPTPTATPSIHYLYNYTFGSGAGDDPHFIQWGGQVVDAGCFLNSETCAWGQDIVTTGKPGGAMNLYVTDINSIAGASPNVSAPADFEYSADIYVAQGKTNARYGLVFGTSLSAFGRSDDTPYFDPNRNLYKFDLQFNETDKTKVSYFRLQRCQNNIDGCANIVEKTTLPAGIVHGTGNWNTITVQRYGSTGRIKVWVNNYLLIDRPGEDTDVNTGVKKFGIFLQSKDANNEANPLKIRFDNVKFRTLP